MKAAIVYISVCTQWIRSLIIHLHTVHQPSSFWNILAVALQSPATLKKHDVLQKYLLLGRSDVNHVFSPFNCDFESLSLCRRTICSRFKFPF